MLIYFSDNLGFFGDDLDFAVCVFGVSEEVFALEWHIALLGALCLAPFMHRRGTSGIMPQGGDDRFTSDDVRGAEGTVGIGVDQLLCGGPPDRVDYLKL